MTDEMKLTRIGEAAAETFGTTLADLIGGSKHSEPGQARIAAMWVAFKLMPATHRKKIAQAFGRNQGEAVGDAVRRVMDMRARHTWFRVKVDGLYQALEEELGAAQPVRTPQKQDAPIAGSAEDMNWGFSTRSGNREYFEAQNKRFAQAMGAAGFRQYVVRE
jgi:hypothetical protein